jgi:hypothetical protein
MEHLERFLRGLKVSEATLTVIGFQILGLKNKEVCVEVALI